MAERTPVRGLIPPDLLATPDLLVAVTGRPEARFVADRPLPDVADRTDRELREEGLVLP